MASDAFERIRRVIRGIPRGRVMTYGDVALAAGIPRGARQVGYALRALGTDVPWHRVLGRHGPRTARITILDPRSSAEQRKRLTREGVRFAPNGTIELARFGWSYEEADRQASGRVATRRNRRSPRSSFQV